VGQLFKAQRAFTKWVLNLVIMILVLSITVFGFIWAIEEENSHEVSNVATAIFDILHNGIGILHRLKSQVITIIRFGEFISLRLGIYAAGNGEAEFSRFRYRMIEE
jgi:hypothetical protein